MRGVPLFSDIRPLNSDRTLQRSFWPVLILLALVMMAFEIAPVLDLGLQDRFYDPVAGRWLVDADDPMLRLFFYTGPKQLLFVFGIVLGLVCFGPARLRRRFMPTERLRRGWMVVFATLVTAPLLVSSLKAVTHVFCPHELSRYGGKEAYQPVFERYAGEDRPERFGRGFPAGHASGGFALLSLAGVGVAWRRRLAGIGVGLVAGSSMGIYQMMKGAHFLSHTMVTLLVCWLVFLVWHRVLVLGRAREPQEHHQLAGYPVLYEVDLMDGRVRRD